MGRPPLNLQTTVVRLAQEDINRIKKIAGPNGMAKFIREAIKVRLEQLSESSKTEKRKR